MKLFIVPLLVLGFSSAALAKLTVVTTTTDLRSIAQEVGGTDVEAEAIAKGTQDPHFVEAKPSFMTRVHKADLVIAVGRELEIGWLPSILRGARNPKVNPGNPGYIELGEMIEALEVPTGKVTRAEGDVHPAGNPHFTLDPIRAGQAGVKLAERLSQLDAEHAAGYKSRADAFLKRMTEKTQAWQSRITKSGVKKVVSYHKTLTYFFDRFKLENPAILEPKPGVPPTSGHILDVIATIKAQKIPLIMVENYFDPTVTQKIKSEVPSIRSETVPVSVEGAPGTATLDSLYEKLVSTIEGK